MTTDYMTKKLRCSWKTHTCTLHVKQTSAGKFTCRHLLTFKPVGLSFFNGTQKKMFTLPFKLKKETKITL